MQCRLIFLRFLFLKTSMPCCTFCVGVDNINMVCLGSLVKLKYKTMCTIFDEHGLRDIWVEPLHPGIVVAKYFETCIPTCDIVMGDTTYYSIKLEDIEEL